MNDSIDVAAELFVPREVVFEAFSDPEHLKGWFPARGEHLAFPNTERDSAWWLLRDDDRHEIEARHRLEAAPPERLIWDVRIAVDDSIVESRVTVAFAGSDGVCRLRVSIEGMADAAERRRQQERWRMRLERLEAYFAAI